MDVEQVTPAVARHGEGPVWSASWGGLRFVDMLAGDVLAVGDGTVTRQHVGDVAAAIRPRAQGGMVVGIERGFAIVDADGAVQRLPELWTDRNIRMNEGACDPQGRFYCGTFAPAAGGGALYQLDVDHTARAVLHGVTVSNGLAWSPDGSTAYYVDTATGRIDAFDHDVSSGLVASSRRVVVECPPDQGRPDGIAVDSDGHLWVALFGGSAVCRYAPDGRCDGCVSLPVTGVTACTFGGGDLDELYITTSRLELDAGEEPAAGAVFRVRPGVAGLPVSDYLG